MPASADERFLVVRLSSLGDIVHTLPAVLAWKGSFPRAEIDWVVDRRWAALLEGHATLHRVIPLARASWASLSGCVRRLRAARYACAIDFQGLYKSAVLVALSGAERKLGFGRPVVRESGAALFYSQQVVPAPAHVVEQNLALAESAGAHRAACRFGLRAPAEAEQALSDWLSRNRIEEFVVVSPGAGWRSKCWPPERYGALCRELARRHGWRAVVNYGPGEQSLAEAVCATSGESAVGFSAELPQLMALLGRGKVVVASDSGPLHLAVALGTPVVGLYGPTDPRRNGPYCAADIVVCKSGPTDLTEKHGKYKRKREYSELMLAISTEEVVAAVEQRLGNAG